MVVVKRKMVVVNTCRRWERGVTLVEIVVAIGIIGLLAAIALPAVQAARDSSQRMRCANNQRQLLVAISGYHELYGVFPPYPGWPNSMGCTRETAMTRLFPFIGLANICDILSSGVMRLPTLECPSDPEITLVQTPLSYILNASPGENSGTPWHGPFEDGPNFGVRVSDVSDGLSSTAGLSESLARRAGGTAANANREPLRYSWNVFVPLLSPGCLSNSGTPPCQAERVQQTEDSIVDCLNGPRDFVPSGQSDGGQWGMGAFGGLTTWTYTHWLPPNSPKCFGGGFADVTFISRNQRAASTHSGGVNVGFLDGHTRFVGSHIDEAVWRAIGTRDGGETKGDEP